ncbi:MAG: S8 family peptidase [Melioribacteraceae bacterium]|nr:S8 family peptidase [Melioribacteraceae bacterium]
MKLIINSLFKKILMSIFLCSLSLSLSAQTNSHLLDGKQYVKDDGKWYVVDSKTDSKYLLDETSLSVKLKEGFSKQAFENYCKALGIEIERENMLGIIDLKLPKTANIFGTYNQFKNSAMFEWIDINSYGEFLTYYPNNDPGFSSQYYIDDRQNDPHINVNEVWEYLDYEEIDQSNVIVAVIDQGVDYNHGDLAGNIWTNAQNYHGYDFYDNDDFPVPLTDDHHGTSIAGIIAAVNNNNQGVAGVAGGWNGSISGSKIMAVRIGAGTILDASKVDDAIIYAANNGAKIINMSFKTDELNAIKNAINYAHNKKGCLIIAASGNEKKDIVLFPASNYNVMAVGGILKNFTIGGSYGVGLELVAPAEGIYSLINSTTSDPYKSDTVGNGTSYSAPQVAGAAALMWAASPYLTQIDVRKVLNQSATNIGPIEEFGNGLLNVVQSFASIEGEGIIPRRPENLSVSIVSSRAQLNWSSVYGVSKYYIYRSNSDQGKYGFEKIAEVNNSTTWTDYSYTAPNNPDPIIYKLFYRVTAIDSSGYESVMSNEVEVGLDYFFKNESDNNILFKYSLGNNYPNPYNPTTTINYELAEDTKVVLKIYDILGREVAELVNEKKSAGIHKVNFNASHLPSGIYLYRMETEHYSDSKKMLLLK